MEQAALVLGVKTRQAHRYAESEQQRIRTKHIPPHNRKLFHRGDVEALAQERRSAPATVQRPKADLVPVGDMLDYIRERDRQVQELQRQLQEAAAQIGYLRGQLEQRMLPEDAAALRAQIDALQRERDTVQAEQRRPWWLRALLRAARRTT